MGKLLDSTRPCFCFNPPIRCHFSFWSTAFSAFSDQAASKKVTTSNWVMKHQSSGGEHVYKKRLDETKPPRKNKEQECFFFFWGGGGTLLEPPGFGVIPSLKTWANNNSNPREKTPCFSPWSCWVQGIDWCFSFRENTPTSYCRSTKTYDHHPTKTSGIHLVFGAWNICMKIAGLCRVFYLIFSEFM